MYMRSSLNCNSRLVCQISVPLPLVYGFWIFQTSLFFLSKGPLVRGCFSDCCQFRLALLFSRFKKILFEEFNDRATSKYDKLSSTI